jgi:hypothetical protein
LLLHHRTLEPPLCKAWRAQHALQVCEIISPKIAGHSLSHTHTSCEILGLLSWVSGSLSYAGVALLSQEGQRLHRFCSLATERVCLSDMSSVCIEGVWFHACRVCLLPFQQRPHCIAWARRGVLYESGELSRRQCSCAAVQQMCLKPQEAAASLQLQCWG